MTTSNEAFLNKRREALKARKGNVPTVEPAEVPAPAPKVQPLRPQRKPATDPEPVTVMDDDSDDADETTDVIEDVAPVAVIRPRSSRTGLALPQADLTRQIDQSDLVMPKLKVSQAMSKVNADDLVRQGNFYHTTFNDNLGKTVLVVPVDMRKSRGYFVQGKGLMCRSFDMLQGEGDPGILCEGEPGEIAEYRESERGCPLRLWGPRDEAGRSSPPACGISYNYPLLLLDRDHPADGLSRRALFSLRGTATRAAKDINSIVTESDLRWHEVVLELSLDQRTNTKGTFYVPTVKYVGLTKDIAGEAVLDRAKRFASQVNAAAIRATIEDDGDE